MKGVYCGCHESYPQMRDRFVSHAPGCPLRVALEERDALRARAEAAEAKADRLAKLLSEAREHVAKLSGDRCDVCDEDGLIYYSTGDDAADPEGAAACPMCEGTRSGPMSRVTKERDEALKAVEANWVSHQQLVEARTALSDRDQQIAALKERVERTRSARDEAIDAGRAFRSESARMRAVVDAVCELEASEFSADHGCLIGAIRDYKEGQKTAYLAYGDRFAQFTRSLPPLPTSVMATAAEAGDVETGTVEDHGLARFEQIGGRRRIIVTLGGVDHVLTGGEAEYLRIDLRRAFDDLEKSLQVEQTAPHGEGM